MRGNSFFFITKDSGFDLNKSAVNKTKRGFEEGPLLLEIRRKYDSSTIEKDTGKKLSQTLEVPLHKEVGVLPFFLSSWVGCLIALSSSYKMVLHHC